MLSGNGLVRDETGLTAIGPGDAFLFKPGEAHQIRGGDGHEDLVLICVADNPIGESWYYPDSKKHGVVLPERRVHARRAARLLRRRRMISYTHGASDVSLIGETIGELLDRVALQYPDREAVVSAHQGVRLRYAQFAQACDEIARGLLALGVQHGERVGIWSTNNVEWTIAQFATAKIGAILVNINPAYRTVELEYVLRQSGVRMLLVQSHYKTSDYLTMVEEVRDRLPDLFEVVAIGDGDSAPSW